MELSVKEIEKIIEGERRRIRRSLGQIETERAYIRGCQKAIKFWRAEFKKARAARKGKGVSRGRK